MLSKFETCGKNMLYQPWTLTLFRALRKVFIFSYIYNFCSAYMFQSYTHNIVKRTVITMTHKSTAYVKSAFLGIETRP